MLRRKGEKYGKHAVAAAPGTHQAIVDRVAAALPKESNILDLGSYTGALLARLRDAGFGTLCASDLTNHLREDGIRFVQSDFNEAFSSNFAGERFDCIIACEVIEHLDDPRRFLKECRRLLADNGSILVSTPNIAFFEGRIKFLLKGELWGFGANNYVGQRHITPLSQEQFPILFDECGYRLVQMTTAGSFATLIRRIVTAPLWIPMRVLFGKRVLGETLICAGEVSHDQGMKIASKDLWGEKQ
jgi:SAM-dependent methyltransferase